MESRNEARMDDQTNEQSVLQERYRAAQEALFTLSQSYSALLTDFHALEAHYLELKDADESTSEERAEGAPIGSAAPGPVECSTEELELLRSQVLTAQQQAARLDQLLYDEKRRLLGELAQAEGQIAALERALGEKDKLLQQIIGSRSFRLGKAVTGFASRLPGINRPK